MSNHNGDTAAFPTGQEVSGGLTKREYFAAQAMKGLVTDPNCATWERVAESSVKIADSLLAELEKSSDFKSNQP